MSISAADIKKLRDATGAGFIDVKKALTEADGDFDKAVEILRITGAAKAAKRGADREANVGLVASAGSAIVEVLSETDFVVKNEKFTALAASIAEVADKLSTNSTEELAAADLGGETVQDALNALSAVIGEKLVLGRVATRAGQTVTYLHKKASDLPPSIGVLVEYTGENGDVVKSAAQQIAALRAQWLTRDDVPAEVLAKEAEIAEAKAKEDGKPEQALPKIVEGTVAKFVKENVLFEQESLLDNKKTVKAVLDEAGVSVTSFAHIEIGA